MLKQFLIRLKQGHRTIKYPAAPPAPLTPRFRGLPSFKAAGCRAGCNACVKACTTGALKGKGGKLSLDMGKCLFCTDCITACPTGAAAFTTDYRLAASAAGDLVVDPCRPEIKLAAELKKEIKKLYGRSLKLRQVSAGGCNACEADSNVLSTIGWDMGRFGIEFTASPRHADGLLVTGPVTENMAQALVKTYEALPEPRIVIAAGTCAVSGGILADSRETRGGADKLIPVDLYVPGCPPHPMTLLDGLLRLTGRIK